MDITSFKPIEEGEFKYGDIRYVARIEEGNVEWAGVSIYNNGFRQIAVQVIRCDDGLYEVPNDAVILHNYEPTHYDHVYMPPI